MHIRLALAAFALTALHAVGAAAQARPAYYCDPLGVYYPAVPTCPVPWRTVGPAPSAPELNQPPSPLPTAEQSAAYRRGAVDWRDDLQAWFGQQPGDRRTGADFWAGNRSKPDHKSCEDEGRDFSGNKSALVVGCLEAKIRLDPIDVNSKLNAPNCLGG